MKNVQMPEKFLVDVFALISRLDGINFDDDTKTLYDAIKMQIEGKMERMERHEIYTKYKTSESDEVKGENRLKYLDKVNMPKNFRY